MAFLIRSIDFTASGREIVRERELAQDELIVGRAAESDIHLPDLAVEQQHVRVTRADDGRLKVEAIGSLGFTLDGRTQSDARIDPREGGELTLGSYRLAFAQEADGRVAVTVRRAEDRPPDKAQALGGFSLGGALPGKRVMAWAGLAIILLAFLVLPIWTHATRERVKPDYDRPGATLMDASWRTGPLSLKHHGLEDNCEACHAEPFVAVRDETCLTCHEDIADHATQSRQANARGPLSPGAAIQWQVAHAFNKPGPGACTDCHTEHEGAGRMQPAREQFCADCHGSLDTRLTDTALGNASDFGKAHPEFNAMLITAAGQKEPQRVSLSDKPRQWNGLRFPHDMHLDKRGGVARMAQRLGAANGYGDPLECNDCHRTTADGVRFLPVDMEQDCESCHSLVIDQVGGVFRKVRHGDAAQARAELLALGRASRPPLVQNRIRPGEYGASGIYRANFGGPATGTALLAGAMAREGLCGECHVPAGRPGSLDVMPVTQPSRYFMHGWFDHDAHKQEQCSSCHAANTSGSSADLLLPGIGQCRDCHQGESTRKAEVPSSCAMCHSYHPPGQPAAAPRRIARK
ncbi:MAG TPA: cytochrome c3 family protein [Croceibacterium sp.]|nr:cytochrome c3 family protein [Croceibacterium sp.]